MKISQKTSLNYVNMGLLVLRIGIGVMFIFHGFPKLAGGPDHWAQIGGAMSNLGITFMPSFWGLMAGFSETIGGLLIILGLAFLPATLLMAFTMFMAFLMHYNAGDSFTVFSHSLEAMILFLSLAITGPGKYRLSQFSIR
ncbi:MAG: DoxX family protein [Salinivirgaceae bacterium]|jgi:putative oxidoreductase|nr:DoxX family protein [Salinivirgaceae bacterium]